MIGPRKLPNGLPPNVYERFGKKRYSIGYRPRNQWIFRLHCEVTETARIAVLRIEAARLVAGQNSDQATPGSVEALIDAWFRYQEEMPVGSLGRRAATTLNENKREAKNLLRAFGHILVTEMKKPFAYAYLDACLKSERPRNAKANKEISLMRTILEYAVRLGQISSNPFDGIDYLPTETVYRYVTNEELELAVEVGRRLGGPRHIVAMALKTAFLCVRRSVEVRALTRDQFKEEGIVWIGAKRQRGHAQQVGVIEWSDELRATIDEALSIKRFDVAGSWYVFGNMKGQRYTKGGWKSTLSKLMNECVAVAAQRKIAFEPFSLQDCRPKGVSDKLERGDKDVVDATLHTSERMVRKVYDRRRKKVAKPAM